MPRETLGMKVEKPEKELLSLIKLSAFLESCKPSPDAFIRLKEAGYEETDYLDNLTLFKDGEFTTLLKLTEDDANKILEKLHRLIEVPKRVKARKEEEEARDRRTKVDAAIQLLVENGFTKEGQPWSSYTIWSGKEHVEKVTFPLMEALLLLHEKFPREVVFEAVRNFFKKPNDLYVYPFTDNIPHDSGFDDSVMDWIFTGRKWKCRDWMTFTTSAAAELARRMLGCHGPVMEHVVDIFESAGYHRFEDAEAVFTSSSRVSIAKELSYKKNGEVILNVSRQDILKSFIPDPCDDDQAKILDFSAKKQLCVLAKVFTISLKESPMSESDIEKYVNHSRNSICNRMMRLLTQINRNKKTPKDYPQGLSTKTTEMFTRLSKLCNGLYKYHGCYWFNYTDFEFNWGVKEKEVKDQ